MRIPDASGLPLHQAEERLNAAGSCVTVLRTEAPRRKTPEPKNPMPRVVRQRNLPGGTSELVVSVFEGWTKWE